MSSMKINRTEFMKLNVMAHMREQKYHTVLDRNFFSGPKFRCRHLFGFYKNFK